MNSIPCVISFALAELLSRRGPERPCETLVARAREAENEAFAA
jgi:hypothetical protein